MTQKPQRTPEQIHASIRGDDETRRVADDELVDKKPPFWKLAVPVIFGEVLSMGGAAIGIWFMDHQGSELRDRGAKIVTDAVTNFVKPSEAAQAEDVRSRRSDPPLLGRIKGIVADLTGYDAGDPQQQQLQANANFLVKFLGSRVFSGLAHWPAQLMLEKALGTNDAELEGKGGVGRVVKEIVFGAGAAIAVSLGAVRLMERLPTTRDLLDQASESLQRAGYDGDRAQPPTLHTQQAVRFGVLEGTGTLIGIAGALGMRSLFKHMHEREMVERPIG